MLLPLNGILQITIFLAGDFPLGDISERQALQPDSQVRFTAQQLRVFIIEFLISLKLGVKYDEEMQSKDETTYVIYEYIGYELKGLFTYKNMQIIFQIQTIGQGS